MVNKSDLPPVDDSARLAAEAPHVAVSAATGAGLDDLQALLLRAILGSEAEPFAATAEPPSAVSNPRHRQALDRAREAVRSARQVLDREAGAAELVAVDMAALGEGQTSDEFHTTICVKDSGGPYHFLMNNKLRRLAETFEIPYRVDIYPYYASDGTAYWRAGGEARVGLVGPGVDASHSYERTHRDALEHSAHLIARYLLDAEA